MLVSSQARAQAEAVGEHVFLPKPDKGSCVTNSPAENSISWRTASSTSPTACHENPLLTQNANASYMHSTKISFLSSSPSAATPRWARSSRLPSSWERNEKYARARHANVAASAVLLRARCAYPCFTTQRCRRTRCVRLGAGLDEESAKDAVVRKQRKALAFIHYARSGS